MALIGPHGKRFGMPTAKSTLNSNFLKFGTDQN